MKLNIFKLYIAIILFTISKNLSAQPFTGIVVDYKTNEALAFVNIQFNLQKQGTTTNIDGKFFINDISKIDFFKISYIGYKDTIITKQNFVNKTKIKIKLKKESFKLNEIKILPTENPAHRIIKLAIKNKKINNPLNLESFEYTSYNKMIFTGDIKKTDTLKPDSFFVQTKNFFEHQHLMIIESVSKRKFKNPDYNNETVLASRVSGLQNPAFTLLATQLQSFSFYKDIFVLYGKKYLSPLSNNSIKKYLFIIQDTIYNSRGDSIFVITFRPRKGKIFNSMKGVLYINSNKYAIQNVIANPTETNTISFKIQQKYELINDSVWFPKQLNTNIIFNNLSLGTGKNKTKIIGIGKTYLYNISFNKDYKKYKFSNIELNVDKKSIKQTEKILKKYRIDSLTEKDKRTYHLIDSLGKAEHLDRKINTMEALLSGYIPIGFLSLDINYLINENNYEGFKPGLGLKTNEKISNYFSVFTNISYGFKNKKYNYKYGLYLTPLKNKQHKIQISYTDDMFEYGGYDFYNENNFTSTEIYRKFMLYDLFNKKEYKISLFNTSIKYLKTNIFVKKLNIKTYNFLYDIYQPNVKPIELYSYGIKLRYAYKEKFIKSNNVLISTGTKYPIIYFNYQLFSDKKNFINKYQRYELKIIKKIYNKTIGTTNISAVGGYISGTPYDGYLYNGHGSKTGQFSIFAENTFATMPIGKYYVDKFISLYIEQNFGNILIRTKKFKPEFAISNNIAFGYNKNKNLQAFTYEKGYYEAGLQINNIINQMNIIKYGIGVFYNYGQYSNLTKIKNNFAYKLIVKFNIQ